MKNSFGVLKYTIYLFLDKQELGKLFLTPLPAKRSAESTGRFRVGVNDCCYPIGV